MSHVAAPHERLQAAADRLRQIGDATVASVFDDGDGAHMALFDPEFRGLLQVLLEGMAAHWRSRPIGDWADYNISPLAAVEKHINAERGGQ